MDIYFGNAAEAAYAKHPLTLIDIGARGGLQPNWRAARRHLRVVAFEADPVEHARLAAHTDPQQALYINAAVAARAGDVTLNVGRSPGTSSILTPNMPFLRRFPNADRFETVKQVAVRADRLDALLAEHDVHDADFFKIDTQGAELIILEGARDTLERSVFGIELEVQFAPLYNDQPSFGALDDYLRGCGFQLFDLRHSYWKRTIGALYGGPKGQLVFGDALYLKTEEAFDQQLVDLRADSEARGSKLLRALSICVLYGYLDYALELLDAHRELIEASVAAAITRQIRSAIPFSARLPHFRGRGFLSHLLYRAHRALFPTLDRWASGGRHLGNIE